MSDGLEACVIEIVRTQLRQPGLALHAGSRAGEIAGWDSVAMIGIILAIEGEFRMQFTAQEMDELRSIGDLSRLARQRGLTAANDLLPRAR